MRILLLTHYYPPEAGAPQTRLAELAAGLGRRGHEVTVHTAPPHYPDGRIRSPYRNRPLTTERTPDGVRILRSAVYATPNRGTRRRLLNHLSHAASSLVTSPAAGVCDVVVAESPPLFTAAAGALYARGRRAPLVLHVADLWPESVVELGALDSPRLIGAAARLARWCYREAGAVAVPTAGMRERLVAQGVPTDRVATIAPAVDLARFPPTDGSPQLLGGPLRLLYAGTLGLAQGVDTLIEAARLAGPKVVEVTLAGGGGEAAQAQAAIARTGTVNVRLAGIVPLAQVAGLYASHHAGAVLLRDRPLFEAALPTKLFETMAAGRAAVVSARGDAARLVDESGCGVVVAPEDPAALAAALRELAGDLARVRAMGAAGRRHVERHHRRETMVDRWVAVLEDVADRRRADVASA